MNNLTHKLIGYLFTGSLLTFFGACDVKEPTDEVELAQGFNSLTNILSEPSGTNCNSGGLKIEVGLDMNTNGLLETEEVSVSKYVCNGELGKESLVRIENIEEDEGCPKGGIQIESGIDENRDSILNPDEISTIRKLCNGLDGKVNEEIRLLLHIDKGGASGTSGTNVNWYPALVKFNKEDWNNAYSLVYSTHIKTDNSANMAITELYDHNSRRRIPNTVLSTNSDEYVRLVSENILDDLPSGDLNLYLWLSSENVNDEIVWITGKSELIILQKMDQ